MFVLLIRTVIMFAVVILLVKIMGRRTIAELQVSELVVTLLISNIASVPMQDVEIPIMTGIIPVATLVVIEVIMSCALMKFPALNGIVNGAPIAVIKNGRIDRKALKKLRMTGEDLFQGLRKKDIFDISTVAYAIVEADGTLSALQYPKDMPPPASDLKIKPKKEKINVLLICDGAIDKTSMEFLELNRNKIDKYLRSHNTTEEEIFIMTADNDGNFEILERKESE